MLRDRHKHLLARGKRIMMEKCWNDEWVDRMGLDVTAINNFVKKKRKNITDGNDVVSLSFPGG